MACHESGQHTRPPPPSPASLDNAEAPSSSPSPNACFSKLSVRSERRARPRSGRDDAPFGRRSVELLRRSVYLRRTDSKKLQNGLRAIRRKASLARWGRAFWNNWTGEGTQTPRGRAGRRATARAATVEQLFREQNEALIRFLVQRLHSREAARGVAQETYVRLLSLHDLGAVSFMRAFLYKTAANIAVDRLRRRAFMPERASGPNSASSQTRAPRAPYRGRPADRAGRAMAFRAAPEVPPGVLLHSAFYGLDFPAIAEHMGFSERSGSRLRRARAQYCRTTHG